MQKRNKIWCGPWLVCNDGNNCFVADYLSNFASIITVGMETVDVCLESIGKIANNCTCLQDLLVFHVVGGGTGFWHWFSSPWAALCWLWNKVQDWVYCALTMRPGKQASVTGIILFLFSFVWWMLQSHVMFFFALINWVKLMCRSYHHWLLPWDLMVLFVLMSMTSRPIWCPTHGSTSYLDEDRRRHRCK
jgi:hypothetical protein